MNTTKLFALVLVLAASSNAALAADRSVAETVRTEVHNVHADLQEIRRAANTSQGRYQPFPDSTGGSSRAMANSPATSTSTVAGARDAGADASRPWSDQRSAD